MNAGNTFMNFRGGKALVDAGSGATVALEECMFANISASNGLLSGVSGRGEGSAVVSVQRCASLLYLSTWAQCFRFQFEKEKYYETLVSIPDLVLQSVGRDYRDGADVVRVIWAARSFSFIPIWTLAPPLPFGSAQRLISTYETVEKTCLSPLHRDVAHATWVQALPEGPRLLWSPIC
jgi:hypothetical protein